MPKPRRWNVSDAEEKDIAALNDNSRTVLVFFFNFVLERSRIKAQKKRT